MQAPKVYIIAEAGVNHNGNINIAKELILKAAEAGVDAVKFQTFKAELLTTSNVKKASYQKDNSKSQQEMLAKLELTEKDFETLFAYAKNIGIDFLSTAFDLPSLTFLTSLNLNKYKIPSGELTNAPLLWQFAKTNKPLLISTGMATLSEVEQALAIINYSLEFDNPPKNLNEIWTVWGENKKYRQLQAKITLLHCTSAYPTEWKSVNLNAMETLAQSFKLNVGYSDHTLGYLLPIAAVAKGAKVIEKHFTLDKNMAGPDHRMSLNPNELKQMADDIRNLESALGSGIKAPTQAEWELRTLARQSVIAKNFIRAGERISASDITTARAGHGVSAISYWDLIGSIANKSYHPGEVLT